MNIATLIKCAERYELLCRLDLSYSQCSEIAQDLEISGGEDLYNFIRSGEDSDMRGHCLVCKMENNLDWCFDLLLHDGFYTAVENAINR